MRKILFLLAVSSSLSSYQASAQNVCTGLLSYTGRDYSTEARENSIAASLYSDHCEGSSSKKGSNTTIGLEAVVKAIPIKFSFGGSSSEEKLNNFCKVYDQRRAEFSSEAIDKSTVVREALTAFNACVGLAARDIYFSPVIGKTRIAVDIKRGSEDAAITGVSYDSTLLSCRFPADDGKGPAVAADKDTNRPLKSAYIAINCDRIAQNDAGGAKIYPSAELLLTTSRGSLLVPIVADGSMPLQFASEITERISQLENRATELAARQMSCDIVQQTTTGHYAEVNAVIPVEAKKRAVLTGGGCMMNRYPALPHNGTVLESRPLDDRSGWHCAAGDPPNQPLNITVTSYAIYCGLKK
jgi:hypothetical protein